MSKIEFTHAFPLSAKKVINTDDALFYLYGQKLSTCSNNDVKLEGKHPLSVILKTKNVIGINIEYKTLYQSDENDVDHSYATDCIVSASKSKCIEKLQRAVKGEITVPEVERAYRQKRETLTARAQDLKDNPPEEEPLNAAFRAKKKNDLSALPLEELPKQLISKIAGEKFNSVHAFVNKLPTTAFASVGKSFTPEDANMLNKFVNNNGSIKIAGNGGLIVFGNSAIKKLHDELNVKVGGVDSYVVKIESVTTAQKVVGLNLKQ